jgi:hypothetical protein
LTGLSSKSGILDSTPLYNFLGDFIKKYGSVLKRKIVVSMVDANSGTYVTFDESVSDPSKAV